MFPKVRFAVGRTEVNGELRHLKKTNATLQKIQKMKMQRCRKRSVEVSQEIAMQKEEKVVALRPGTGMLKGMELIQKYIGMHLTMKIFNY